MIEKVNTSHQPNSWQLMKRLARDYIKPHRGKLIVAFLAIIVVAITTFMQVRLLEPIFDFILVNGNETFLYILPPLFLFLSVMRGLAMYVQTQQLAKVGHKIVEHMQNQLYSKLITGDVIHILADQSGKLMTRFSFEMQLIRNVVTKSMLGAVRDTVLLLVYCANLFYTNWQLACVILVIFPIIIFVIVYIGRKLRGIAHRLQDQTGIAGAFLSESFRGIVQIKAYGSENFMQKRAEKIFNILFRANFKQEEVRARMLPIIESLFGLTMAITIFVSGFQVLRGETTVGAFMSFFTALLLAYQPLRSLSAVNAGLQEGLAATERILKMIDQKPKITVNKNAKDLVMKTGAIEFNNISFSYKTSEQRALHDINFKVKGQQKIALVGPSGAGKSTLFNLLMRFYDPQDGHIAIDGQNIKDMTIQSLRKKIAVVSQEQGVFNDSIAANIAFGDDDYDFEKIRYAANMADADGFINRLSDKYQSIAGENGALLSGGQRQRLAIARAIYKNAPIMLLDEATSALDQRSEDYIQQAMEKLTQNRTVLIIAHRLSTVRDADMIYVLEHGKISEYGKHQDLLAQNGLYTLLYKKGEI